MSSTQQLPRHFGKYVLVRKIAMGGMAEIFKAKTGGAEGFEKDVVIKRILPHFTEDADFVKMFIDEASITSKLQHANIVQIFDFDVCEGSYYIAMELIEGVDLKKAIDNGIKSGNPLSVAQCVWTLMETSKGLHYAHVKEHKGQPLNIVHRDISPHNVMVSYNGEVKLMDFGIAKAAQRSTKTMAGTVKGKVAYMSPEQARGKNLDGRSDLFALGIMLWEMLTGKRLFLGDSDFETLTNVLKNEAPAPSTINPKVDPQLDAIVLKALAKDRDERHESVEAFARDLTRWYYSTVTDLEGESLKKFMHELFAEDIEQNRRLAAEERGETLPPSSSTSVASAPAPMPQPVENQQNERTLAMPAADAGAPTILDGSLSQAQLQGLMANQGTFQANQNAQSQGSQQPKSKTWLWVLIALLFLGGGGAAAFVLLGGDKKADGPEPAAVAPAKEKADLIVKVEPEAARVFVDDKAAGSRVRDLDLGSSVKVVAEAPGFERYSEIVKVDEKTTVLEIKLERERERVQLVFEAEGDEQAEIFVNGKSIGRGAQIYSGYKDDLLKVEVKPSKPGLEPVELEVVLDGSHPVRKIPVAKAGAQLIITVDPEGAEVTASKGELAMGDDGKSATISGLELGDNVEITVSKDGYAEKAETIALSRAEQTIAIKLTKDARQGGTTTPKRTTTSPVASGKGTISVRARPWANVSIGGRPVGMTPKDIPVDAGTHTIVLSKGSQTVTKNVTVGGGKTATVSHSFD